MTEQEKLSSRIDQLAADAEYMMQGMVLLVRWPHALLWIHRKHTHDWHQHTKNGRRWFTLLLCAGLVSQDCLILLAIVTWLGDPSFKTAFTYAGVIYASLTATRMALWIGKETDQV